MSIRDTLAGLVALYGREAKAVRQAYGHAFRGDRLVLKDLAGFARIGEASADDPAEARRIEGRREVFWHIANMLRIEELDIERIVNEESYRHDDSRG